MKENTETGSKSQSKIRIIFYWITTIAVAWELMFGGLWDLGILNKDYVLKVMSDLGYPYYMPYIFGTWKILAGIAILLPGFPRLKEWAYAGVFFVFSGACFSHLFMGETSLAIQTLIFTAIPMISWALRPASRRLAADHLSETQIPEEKEKKWKVIVYWVATALLGIGMLQSGIFAVLRNKQWIDLVTALGYPVYFLTILGVWKILGVIAIIVPRFKLLKEWAYAGFFFAMTGALASHLFCHDYAIKSILGPSFQVLFTVVSWYFRPASRKIVVS
jgi:uncharacterized membrane protein YphA (DoxX/SURF4 family)